MRDAMVMYEVMTDTLDARWWQSYRQELERRFRQEKIMVRALPVQPL